MARTARKSGVKEVPLSEIKDDLSRYLREAEIREIVITRHGKPAGVLIGFESEGALRLPASLKRAVEEVAREDGTTLNQFIVSAVAEKLAALKTADYFAKRAAHADLPPSTA
jgi:prevent-host-death family protein